MGDLNAKHEAHLALSLEDPKKFGTAITLLSSDAVGIVYDLYGMVNKTADVMGEAAGMGRPVGSQVHVALRYTSIMGLAGYPGDVDWVTKMPVPGWRVRTTDPWTGEVETYLIEPGSMFHDRTMGILLLQLARIV